MDKKHYKTLAEKAREFDTFEDFNKFLLEAEEFPFNWFQGYQGGQKESLYYLEKHNPGQIDHSNTQAYRPELTKLSEIAEEVFRAPYESITTRESNPNSDYLFLSRGSHINDDLKPPFGFGLYLKPKIEIDKGTFYEGFLTSLSLNYKVGDKYALYGVKRFYRWLISIVEFDMEIGQKLPKNYPSLKK